MNLEGRVAVVTGASRGIGAAIAQRFAAEGARVAAVARTLEPDARYGEGSLVETVQTITNAGGEAFAVQADLTNPEDRQRVVTEAAHQLGPIDILVNNAAVMFAMLIAEVTDKRYDVMFELGVRAPFHLTQLVLPDMRARQRGSILNISSRGAAHPTGPPYEEVFSKIGVNVYGMCKAALDRFSTGLAAEVFEEGIAVNALSPWGVVPTHGARYYDLTGYRDIEPAEIMAEAALLLCSGDPSLTGRVAYSQPLLSEFGRQPVVRSG